jgi:hypothetical protein
MTRLLFFMELRRSAAAKKGEGKSKGQRNLQA